jgi:50S ribosomal protein L16 3-hydroxylase
VGPHVDSYDVFLLQVSGQRRWRISTQKDLSLQEGKPLKILQNFWPEEEWVLEPGDMLYLPPHCAHDGVAETGDCMTYSVGFRAPTDSELTQEVLLRLGEYLADDEAPGKRYADPKAQATESPGQLPAAMLDFAAQALQRLAANPLLLARALGEVLSEPKPSVQFDGEGLPEAGWASHEAIALDRRTRMLHDAQHVFVNGEAFVVGGKDGRLLRQLADVRALTAREAAGLSEGARAVMEDWIDMGWLHVQHE